jgi:ferredoxin-thioredoxin reductase catalytic subunit/rubredoxin
MASKEDIEETIHRLKKEAQAGNYNLNPNREDLEIVIDGYLEAEKKYGYPACPCRLADGDYEKDKDIVCPCAYRDDDITEYGACYCSLYVDDDIASGEKAAQYIPERRPAKPEDRPQAKKAPETVGAASGFSTNIWRCTVCGYLAAKEQPPAKCPICNVGKDRFELFIKAG